MMWPFGRKNTPFAAGAFRGFTDFHSHILPGVDDGVPSMAGALDVLAMYDLAGVKDVWLTPHVMEDVPNTTAGLLERFDELKAAYRGRVGLHLAAEYMIDNLLRERLDDGDLLPLGDRGDRLLVETSCYSPPINLPDMLERIKARGLHPVLAHPERYVYMACGDYLRLCAAGVQMQLNLPSLAGFYGRAVRSRARRLLNDGCYALAGTDIHSREQARQIMCL